MREARDRRWMDQVHFDGPTATQEKDMNNPLRKKEGREWARKMFLSIRSRKVTPERSTENPLTSLVMSSE